MSTQRSPKKVRILVNRRSGFMWSFETIQRAFDRHWETADNDLSYQFCRDPEDSRRKVLYAIEQGFDIIFAVGGDGTISTVGSVLIGSDTVLGAIPIGSGNGFARHFGIPLHPDEAAQALAKGTVRRIDVGTVNNQPFLVTCSMAWDAALVKAFEKSPIRGGILPYVFAGVYEFFEYKPQEITAELDTGEVLSFSDPMVFTIANLSQYGGGAIIAPDAQPDDGMLELIVVRRQNAPILFANIHHLFKGSISSIPSVIFRRFRSMVVRRASSAQIQVDGELVDAPAEIRIDVKPHSLSVLTPPT